MFAHLDGGCHLGAGKIDDFFKGARDYEKLENHCYNAIMQYKSVILKASE